MTWCEGLTKWEATKVLVREYPWSSLVRLRDKPKTVKLVLSRYEAEELAGYLAGTWMKLSVGDRLMLAKRIERLLSR
jgi:hypothetical protein